MQSKLRKGKVREVSGRGGEGRYGSGKSVEYGKERFGKVR